MQQLVEHGPSMEFEPAPVGEPPSRMLDTLILLASRRRTIALFTGLITVCSIVIVLVLPNKYTATTTILPPTQITSMSSAMLGQLTGSAGLASLAGAGLGIKNPADMYVALFQSRTVEDALIQRFDLMRRYRRKNMVDTRTEFESQSNVILGLKDNLIRLSFTDKDPLFAADVANAWIEEFHKHSDSLAITEAAQRREFFQRQLLEATGNLAKAEQAMRDTQRSTGVLQVDSQARSLIESAAVLRGQIAAKEVQLQAMHSYATETNPQVQIVASELATLRSQLNRLTGSSSGGEDDLSLGRTKMADSAMATIDKTRDVRYYETIEQLISRQFEAAKLDEARQGAVVQVADVAVPPDKKASPHRSFIIVVAMLLSFVTSLVWVFAQDRWRRSMSNPGRSAQASQLKSLLSRRSA